MLMRSAIFKLVPPTHKEYTTRNRGLLCIGYVTGKTHQEVFVKWVRHLQGAHVLKAIEGGIRYFIEDMDTLLAQIEDVSAKHDAICEMEAKQAELQDNELPNFVSKFN